MAKIPSAFKTAPIPAAPAPAAAQTAANPKIQPAAVQAVEAKTATRKIKVIPPYGYPIHVYKQGIFVFPGVPTEVEVDRWIETQIECGVLKEV